MQPSTSLSSISSNNSSIYGSQTILNVEDLPLAAPRCRSSIISSLDNEQTIFSPNRRRTQQLSSNRSVTKCRHLFRTCLSSTSTSLSLLIQKKLSDHTFRKQYFTKLCRNHQLLLVLNDYQCKCGCHFSMKQGTFVILYETKTEFSSLQSKNQLVTVISNHLICSKVPSHFICDMDILRERVRSRTSCNNEQSFDL
ncbi:unnamed protein product [Adineta steineri]|uniref:Uncharacterized protein n=1 Tax=Adineta steineri TaxID=433720 RepID=A0A815THP8_9BILA|nr:unnamed protein product [Adineta steineri]CAF1644514.1 unnamed protein product [Adineta steineri]